jgi:hypothetical protein
MKAAANAAATATTATTFRAVAPPVAGASAVPGGGAGTAPAARVAAES